MSEIPQRPRLAITLGDVAGISPEVVVRALVEPSIRACCQPLVIGDPVFLDRAARSSGLNIRVESATEPRWLDPDDGRIVCWNPVDAVGDVELGHDDARAGRAAYEWVRAGARLAIAGRADGLVTAPLSKRALSLGGIHFPGHTEILEHECGVQGVRMMLYLPPGEIVQGPQGLAVAHVTLHTSIASVPGLLSTTSITQTIALVDRFLRRVGCARPRVGVCALNPHAGEGGLFGSEEQDVIRPAVEEALAMSIAAAGPAPADTLLKRAVDGEFDGVVAMYHDQGHIALKLIAFGRAVNVTLGLPIVRTSPSHGTAFDIAGRGIADPTGMMEAIRVATLLIGSR